MMGTFLGTDTAPFTDLETGLKPGRFLFNALRGAIGPTRGTFNAFVTIHFGPFSPPISGFKL